MRKAFVLMTAAVLLVASGCCTFSNDCPAGARMGMDYQMHTPGPIGKWIFGNLIFCAGPVGMLVDIFTGHSGL